MLFCLSLCSILSAPRYCVEVVGLRLLQSRWLDEARRLFQFSLLALGMRAPATSLALDSAVPAVRLVSRSKLPLAFVILHLNFLLIIKFIS